VHHGSAILGRVKLLCSLDLLRCFVPSVLLVCFLTATLRSLDHVDRQRVPRSLRSNATCNARGAREDHFKMKDIAGEKREPAVKNAKRKANPNHGKRVRGGGEGRGTTMIAREQQSEYLGLSELTFVPLNFPECQSSQQTAAPIPIIIYHKTKRKQLKTDHF